MLPLLYFTADIIRLYLVCYAAAQVLKCNYVHICNVSAAAIMEEENDLVTSTTPAIGKAWSTTLPTQQVRGSVFRT